MRPILLHNHIFKNAGTTVDWALQRSFGRGFVDHRDDDAMMQGGLPYVEQLVRSTESLRALSSHHMPFAPAYVAPGLQFWHLFMLRDPFERAMSVYAYERRQPSSASEGAAMAKVLSMQEYFRWYLHDLKSAAVLRSHYVRQLTQDWESEKVIGAEDVDIAVRNSIAPQVLVGLVERFDESMVLLELALRGVFPEIDLSYIRQNQRRQPGAGARQELLKRLGPDLFDSLLANVTLDLDLYRAVEERMNQLIAGVVDFEDRVQEFRVRCTNLWLAMNKEIHLLRTIMDLH